MIGPNQYGNGHENLLFPTSSMISSMKFFKKKGNSPMKILFRNINTWSSINDPIDDGISRDKILSMKSRNTHKFKWL